MLTFILAKKCRSGIKHCHYGLNGGKITFPFKLVDSLLDSSLHGFNEFVCLYRKEFDNESTC